MSRRKPLKLLAKSKNRNEISEVSYIKRDGWIVTKAGAMGDHTEDCETFIEEADYCKELRKRLGMSQQEMSWVLGISRPTYTAMENGKRELTHKEYLLLQLIKVDREQVNRFRSK